jgi:regulator of sirC expression with transglutaminase-like and TPR domain
MNKSPKAPVPVHPACCHRAAWRMMQQAAGDIEAPASLLVGAVAISLHHLHDADFAEVDQTLQSMADAVRAAVRGPQPQAVVAHLHEMLFERLGFGGDSDDFFNPLNSYVPAALHLRRGLPITLSLIYREVGRRLGLDVRGVGLPGHFIVSVEMDGALAYVDPFHAGRLLSADDAFEMVRELFGEEAEWSSDMLAPVSNRHWLGRMLQNLLHVFTEAEQFHDVAAMLELQMLLWPTQPMLQRDLGLVLARLGKTREASLWIRRYLRQNPNDPIVDELKSILGALSS